MDLIKIGAFLRALRKEKGYTQEQLGEELGITNKTVSRWETGTYLPPVEMLQQLSALYRVSINEILSGERLTEETYREKAEENITNSLKSSVFTAKDRIKYFKRKWLKDHAVSITLFILAVIAMYVVGIVFDNRLEVVAPLIAISGSFYFDNAKASYIEYHVYEEKLNSLEKGGN